MKIEELEKFRDRCLRLGEVTEKMPFGRFAKRYDSILAFYILGHMFCFIDIDDFTWVNLRLIPEEIDELREKYASIRNPMNQSLKYWIQVEFNGDMHDAEIYRLINRAYEIVKEKYSKRP